MMDPYQGREERGVRITTIEGVVEGFLQLAVTFRTLDDLNAMSKRFIFLNSPSSRTPAWQVGRSPLAVNKNAILFVQELSAPPLEGGPEYGIFTHAAVRLRLREFEVKGLVHVPEGGSPMQQLDQGEHAFMPLTKVSVSGAGESSTVPFLAINRNFIAAAQVSNTEEDAERLSSEEAEIQS